jgi:phage FluMu protein Com
MPIRFVCKHCGQKLSVGSSRAGTKANCPRCKELVRVPGEAVKPTKAALAQSMLVMSGEGAAVETASHQPPSHELGAHEEPAAPPIAGEAEPAIETSELVFDTSPSISAGGQPASEVVQQTDYSLVTFPRYVLYAQAGLLAGVAVICFTLGLAMGGAFFAGSSGPVAAKPCTITGFVQISQGVVKKGDEGAVVFVLPQDSKNITERAPVAGLRPRDTEPEGNHRGLAILREMGAGHARADKDGKFKVTVPKQGKYFVLVISRSKTGDGADVGSSKQKIARFFENANDLIGTQKFQFSAETLSNDRKYDVSFE